LNKAKVISGLIGLVVTLPIWFYILHYILVQINASELVMFLFWVYLPVTFILSVVVRVIDDN